MRLSLGLWLLVACAPLATGMTAQSDPKPPAAAPPQTASPAPAAAPAPAPAAAPAAETPAPPPAVQPAPPPPPPPAIPLYTLDVDNQDADDTITAFMKRAGENVILLDRAPTLITVHFRNLPFERGLKEILRAADLDFVKDEDGYTVGLAIDLALRFPNPNDKIIEATYRCRRIAAATLVKSIQAVLAEADFKVSIGPEFLTPPVEGGSGDSGVKTLTATDANYRTHEVVFSGPPALVHRALSLCRKFDHPRKQVRVNIRVVEMTTTASRNLGVAWMPNLVLQATEVASPNPNNVSVTPTGATSPVPQGNGLTLGKFTHSVVSLNATLNAIEQTGEAKTIANPTLLVLDGEKSFILSGTKYIFPQINSKDPSGQAIYTTVDVKLGLYLQVGVQVGLDDDMVLTIYPQITTLTGTTTVNAVPYPIISTIEEQATVRALKGDVIVMGGIKQEVTEDNKTGVPFLANLPFLGKLFSSDSKSKNTEELVFFLTPELIDDPDVPLDMKLSVSTDPKHPAS